MRLEDFKKVMLPTKKAAFDKLFVMIIDKSVAEYAHVYRKKCAGIEPKWSDYTFVDFIVVSLDCKTGYRAQPRKQRHYIFVNTITDANHSPLM